MRSEQVGTLVGICHANYDGASFFFLPWLLDYAQFDDTDVAKIEIRSNLEKVNPASINTVIRCEFEFGSGFQLYPNVSSVTADLMEYLEKVRSNELR